MGLLWVLALVVMLGVHDVNVSVDFGGISRLLIDGMTTSWQHSDGGETERLNLGAH
jgi:hypothetical protein